MRHGLVTLSIFILAVLASQVHANDPATTIRQSEQVLAELVAIPGRQIPTRLLNQAEGLAIIPRVIKIGFVAGVRRGHGVVLIRDADGNWGLPRFVTLTGGSVGWQAGVQGTDVVLVFTTRRSVENLLRGKFTVGVDAAAAAGPVGRNASAATDTSLQAEILSYSRSRGLFLGGFNRRLGDRDQSSREYGLLWSDRPRSPSNDSPSRYADAIVRHGTDRRHENCAGTGQSATTAEGANAVVPATAITPIRVEALRQSLTASSAQLAQLLNPDWEKYLALPAELQNPEDGPDIAALENVFARFELVSGDAKFGDLTARPEFQSTKELLRAYIDATRTAMPTLVLPAPARNHWHSVTVRT